MSQFDNVSFKNTKMDFKHLSATGRKQFDLTVNFIRVSDDRTRKQTACEILLA